MNSLQNCLTNLTCAYLRFVGSYHLNFRRRNLRPSRKPWFPISRNSCPTVCDLRMSFGLGFRKSCSRRRFCFSQGNSAGLFLADHVHDRLGTSLSFQSYVLYYICFCQCGFCCDRLLKCFSLCSI